MGNGNGEKPDDLSTFSQRMKRAVAVDAFDAYCHEMAKEARAEGHQEPQRGYAAEVALQLGMAAWRAGWRIKNGSVTPPVGPA